MQMLAYIFLFSIFGTTEYIAYIYDIRQAEQN